jgi:hypothetical protein
MKDINELSLKELGKLRVALGGMYIMIITDTIQAVSSGSYKADDLNIGKNIVVTTKAFHLPNRDQENIMKNAVTIAINKSIAAIGEKYSIEKEQILDKLWPGKELQVTLTLDSKRKFGWDLSLDS